LSALNRFPKSHLFLKLFAHDPGFGGNVFSALTLACAAPVAYAAVARLLHHRLAAAAAVLFVFWSYYVWLVGLFAEIYAPQILAVAICGYTLVRLNETSTRRWALGAGVAFGICVAIHPVNAVFAPSIVAIYLARRIPMPIALIAGGVAVLVVGVTALYFPIRYAVSDSLALNLSEAYTADGSVTCIPLNTLAGILWMLSGRQFDWLFFESAPFLPTALAQTAVNFFRGLIGIGVVLGGVGLVELGRRRGLVIVWGLLFVPYTLFFATYGAVDRSLMFGPAYLLWILPLGAGFKWLYDAFGRRWGTGVLIALPLIILAVHLPRLNLSGETSVRTNAEAILNIAPADAHLFGIWTGITPIEYLHIVEGVRPDVTVYNLYQFETGALPQYLTRLADQGEPLLLVDSQALNALPPEVLTTTLRVITLAEIPTRIGEPRLMLFLLVPRYGIE